MIATTPPGYNCEALTPNFQVRWRVVRGRDAASSSSSSSAAASDVAATATAGTTTTTTTAPATSIAFELITRGIDHEKVYIGLGVSGRPDEPHMIGGDVVIADYYQGKPRARDFNMNARAPCSTLANRKNEWQSALGVCPDTAETFVNDVPTDRISGVRLQQATYDETITSTMENGGDGSSHYDNDSSNNSVGSTSPQGGGGGKDELNYLTLIRYRHPVTPHDVNVIRNGSHDVDRLMSIQQGVLTTIIWALGPIDASSGQPLFHSHGYSQDFIQWELGRSPPVDHCEALVLDQDAYEEDYNNNNNNNMNGDHGSNSMMEQEPVVYPFSRPVLTDTVEFRAHLGPYGGARGYPSITGGRAPDNMAWYINGTCFSFFHCLVVLAHT